MLLNFYFKKWITRSLATIYAKGYPVAFEAKADDLERRGLTSIMMKMVGSKAYWILHSPIIGRRITLKRLSVVIVFFVWEFVKRYHYWFSCVNTKWIYIFHITNTYQFVIWVSNNFIFKFFPSFSTFINNNMWVVLKATFVCQSFLLHCLAKPEPKPPKANELLIGKTNFFTNSFASSKVFTTLAVLYTLQFLPKYF